MSKFLIPLTWYNSVGVLDESLTATVHPYQFCSNTAYGRLAEAGNDTGTTDGAIAIGDYSRALTDGAVAIGGRTDGEKSGATSVGSGAISIGSSAQATQIDGIAIGRGANANGGIAIGPGATTSGETNIQLGNNNTAYDLQIGNGRSTISGILKIRNFESSASSVSITDIIENRKYIFFITMQTNNDTNFYSSILFKETGTRDRIGSPIVILNNKGDLITYRPVFVSNTTGDASTDGTLYFYYNTETTISGTVNYIKVYVLEIM